MNELDRKECLKTSVALQKISLLGLVVFITIPSVFFLKSSCVLNIYENILLLANLISGMILAIMAWHLNFDGALLKNLGNGNFELSDVDQIVFDLFHKNIQSKTLNERIIACYKLIKGFFILLILHLIIFFGVIVFY